jgi:hypothetical protein
MRHNDAVYKNNDNLITRRSIFIGAAASLLCAPAIVRATSLMPVRSLGGPIGPQYAGFVERLFYHSLDSNLKAGCMSTVLNGKIISEADARRMVSYARAQGWLPKPAECFVLG